jgi:hypothetical protein
MLLAEILEPDTLGDSAPVMFALELIFGIGSTALVWANMPALTSRYKE